MTFQERYGDPFGGKDLDQLIKFLNDQQLDYDRNIEHTMIIEDGGKIIATASCHGNVLKCVAVSQEYQGHNLMGQLMTHMIGYFFDKWTTHYFGFTKIKNKAIFCNLGFYPVAETEDIILLENKKNGLKKYILKLQKETEKAKTEKQENQRGEGIGAIIANCNPFTLGHRYLIEEASKRCKWLHLFILSMEQEFITSDERFRLVQKGTEDIKNVILHRTSDYLISPAVFPTYFIKDKANAYEMNCMLDLKIFTESIAPALGITKRFVGTEPNCEVTNAYNICMKKELPLHHITLEEIRRREEENKPISASYVRACFQENEIYKVKNMVPDSTYAFLTEKKKRQIEEG